MKQEVFVTYRQFAAGAITLFIVVFLAVAVLERWHRVSQTMNEALTFQGKWLVTKVNVDPKSLEAFVHLERIDGVADDKLVPRTVLDFVKGHPDNQKFRSLAELIRENPKLVGSITVEISFRDKAGELNPFEVETFLFVSTPSLGIVRQFAFSWRPPWSPAELLFGF